MCRKSETLIVIFETFTVNYKVELHDPRSGGFMPSSPGIGMHVEVKDPDDKVILSRVYSSEGELLFLGKVSFIMNAVTH